MLTILVTSVAGNADAQFWKKKNKRHSHKHKHEDSKEQKNESDDDSVKDEKISKKEKKKKDKKDRRKKKQDKKEKKKKNKKTKEGKKTSSKKEALDKHPADVPAVVVANKQDKRSAHASKKYRYRVDVLAPLYLDELVKGGTVTYKDKIPDKALPGVAFYAGINIAADSLKKEGFNIDIYIHDVSSAAESVDRLTTLGGLDSTDLIIGAVPPADIPMLADYAKKNAVNFISTLSASDGNVRDNTYFTMMQPSLKTHCEWIIEDIQKKFPKQKIALIYQTKGDMENTAYNTITDAPADGIRFKYLACNTLPKRANFDLVVDELKTNVMIVSVIDVEFADSLLHRLSRNYPGTHFEIYGMPSWTSIPDLRDAGAFPNLTINITTPFTVDPNTTTGQYVKHVYKQYYTGKISESVFRGYETMFWYANLLKKYGTHFNDKYSENSVPAPFNQFDIQAAKDNSGHSLYYENKHIFLSTYEGGVYKVK